MEENGVGREPLIKEMVELHIGIDVGGTFTDGVLLDKGQVVRTTKTATDMEDLKGTLMEAMDVLLSGINPASVQRLVLSTTLVTNTIATGSGEPTGLFIIPGPGMTVNDLNLPGYVEVLAGAVDFRGRVCEPLNPEEIQAAAQRAQHKGIKNIAVAGKFSGRNPELEEKAAQIIKDTCPAIRTITGSSVAGGLNFPRRAVTAYYTAMTMSSWQQFVEAISEAIKERGISCPLSVLKADGGTVDLMSSLRQPCETIFSGPSASAMGAVAMVNPEGPAVVVDIGGTTTDLALILDGEPLQASKGARIEGKYSHINAVAVSSLALGGDSLVSINKNKEVCVGPVRMGAAACYGGSYPTPTDAYNILHNGIFGNLENSEEVFWPLARECNWSLQEIASDTMRVMVGGIYEGILHMFRRWEEEPAYKVWEIVNRRKIKPQLIIGVGAAARLAVPNLAALFAAQPVLHAYTPVGNALGAAVARPTLQIKLHVDTTTGKYNCDLDGIRGVVPKRFSLSDAEALAHKILTEAAGKRNMRVDTEDIKIYANEQFNVIRGWDTAGKIFDVGIKVAAGVIPEYKGAI